MSLIQISDGERIQTLMNIYYDLEGDPMKISFSNLENYLFATTFRARPMTVYTTYTEYALVSEAVALG